MPSFEYLAIDTSGRERRGSIDGQTIDDAKKRLDARRYFVVRIEPSGTMPAAANENLDQDRQPNLFGRQIAIRKKLSVKQLTLFTRQLATLVEVAPLEESLKTIAQQSEQDASHKILQNVQAGVTEGRALSHAMEIEKASFPALYRAMIAAGERSGALPAILTRLADLLERQSEIRGKILTALTYPIMLTIVAITVVFALMIFVVPQVVDQFDSVGQQLPLLTRAVLGFSTFLQNWWWLVLIGIAFTGTLFWRAMRRETFKLRFDSWVLRLPVIGKLVRDLHAARMARTLATMLQSRLPLLEGLTLTTRTVKNAALRKATEEITESIRQGGSLSAAFARSEIFPPLLVYMANSGESAGRLETMLERAADYLEREFDAFTSRALSLLEPAIIVIMGGIVTLIILAILLPILQLNTIAAGA